MVRTSRRGGASEAPVSDMHEVVRISIADLQLDPTNARLVDDDLSSQQAVYAALAREEGRHLINLADDIVRNGLDPTTLPAVVPTGDQRKRYKVIEGNRRVLALKALETPAIVASGLTKAEQRRLAELSAKYAREPRSDVECVLFENEEEAYHWIDLRHTGANDGVGLVEWDSNQKDRYKARHGGAASRTAAGQIIDFVTTIEEKGGAKPRPATGILTNVKRLISTRAVRDVLGIDINEGEVVSWYPITQIAPGLHRIVDDLRSRRIKVNDIYYETDRLTYIQGLKKEELPDPDKKLAVPVSLVDLAKGRTNPVEATGKKRNPRKRQLPPRTAIVPSNFVLNVTPPRINTIYLELSSLSVDQYPNACAVLLRVFLELSVDHAIDKAQLMSERERSNAPLARRLKVVAQHLKDTGEIGEQLQRAIQKIADSQDVISASTVTFNQYVHNQYVYPKPTELRTAWDELQPFIEKLWP
jgi:hypothetical protein